MYPVQKSEREKREFIKRIKSQCMFPIDRWALIINISSQFLLSESLYRIMLPACTEHSRLYIHQWWCFRTLSGICRKSSEIFEHENIWLLPTWGMWWCDNNMRDEKRNTSEFETSEQTQNIIVVCRVCEFSHLYSFLTLINFLPSPTPSLSPVVCCRKTFSSFSPSTHNSFPKKATQLLKFLSKHWTYISDPSCPSAASDVMRI